MKVFPFTFSRSFCALCASLSCLSVWAAPSACFEKTPALIPEPSQASVKPQEEGFLLGEGLLLAPASSKEEKALAEAFMFALKEAGIPASMVVQPIAYKGEVSVKLAKAPLSEPLPGKLKKQEGYVLNVTPQGISVEAETPAGAYYAGVSLAQACLSDKNGQKAFPSLEIKDSPRFSWRGLMVDSGRNPYTVEEIKKIIDLMAFYKLNVMHWHLTEDQGWRLEIKKYPKLTTVGATRSGTPMLGQRSKKDDKPFSFSYTQKEVKEVVDYAHKHHITVVPEIEVPGHATAAVSAYPELGNMDIPQYDPVVEWRWGVYPYIFAPTEKTFGFLDDVFSEVVELFPQSPYVHIGGDEAPKGQWKNSPQAQEIMKKKGLKNEEELQSYFIARVEAILNNKGKSIIGWDEIQEGGLSKTATMMVWRDWKWAKHAVAQGNDIVMTPNSHAYLDYGQGEPYMKGKEFDYIGGNLPLEKVYSLEPIPADYSPEEAQHVVGVQGNCWSEYLPTLPKWQYMIFPRALAIAEVAWTLKKEKNWTGFQERAKAHEALLDKREVNYRRQEDGKPAQPSQPMTRP